jgi:hypothetical protein
MKLPRVYVNKIDKSFDNNNSYYRNSIESKVDLYKLRTLFDRNGFADRVSVDMKTNNGWNSEKLVLLKDNYFVDINNKKIYFEDILDYKIKK